MLKKLLAAVAIPTVIVLSAVPASATSVDVNALTNQGILCVDGDNILGINLDVAVLANCYKPAVVPTHHNPPPVIVVPPVVVDVPPVLCVTINAHCGQHPVKPPKTCLLKVGAPAGIGLKVLCNQPPVHRKPPVVKPPVVTPPVIVPVSNPTQLPHTGAGDPWFAASALVLMLGGAGLTVWSNRKSL